MADTTLFPKFRRGDRVRSRATGRAGTVIGTRDRAWPEIRWDDNGRETKMGCKTIEMVAAGDQQSGVGAVASVPEQADIRECGDRVSAGKALSPAATIETAHTSRCV